MHLKKNIEFTNCHIHVYSCRKIYWIMGWLSGLHPWNNLSSSFNKHWLSIDSYLLAISWILHPSIIGLILWKSVHIVTVMLEVLSWTENTVSNIILHKFWKKSVSKLLWKHKRARTANTIMNNKMLLIFSIISSYATELV